MSSGSGIGGTSNGFRAAGSTNGGASSAARFGDT